MIRLAILAFFLFSVTAQAATYHVAKTGSGSTCSEASPCLTIATGLGKLGPDDTLYVHAGTYAEELTSAFPTSGSSGHPITVAAYPGDAVIIKPNAGANFVIMLDDLGGGTTQSYITIDGFEIDGTNVLYDTIKIYAHNVIIRNCNIHGAAGSGQTQNGILIPVWTGADNNQILNNTIHDGGGTNPFSNGIYAETKNNVIDGNRIYNYGGAGISLWSQTANSSDGTIVRNNVIYNSSLGAVNDSPQFRGQGIILANGDNQKAYNNVIYGYTNASIGTAGAAISVFYSGTGNLVANNTIYGNRMVAVRVDVTTSAQIKNNIIYSNGTESANEIIENGTNTVYSNNLCTAAGTGCAITGNPQFANAAGGNFYLNGNSPARDAGADLSATFTTDLDGKTRRLPFDLGAYEYLLGVNIGGKVSMGGAASAQQ